MLNLTFFAQIVHFWLAYLLLERILLRKIVALVRTEKHENAQAEKQVLQEAAQVKHQEELVELAWQEMQQALHQQQPPIEQPPLVKIKNGMQPVASQLNSAEKEALVTALKNEIVKELVRD